MAMLLALVGAPGAAALPPLVVAPAGTVNGQVRLVVEVPDGAQGPIRPEAFSVSVAGAPQPATAGPVLSDRLAMALVVDASAEGSRLLPAGLSGVANFLLAAPRSARSTLVVDNTPPTVAVPWPSGQADTLRGLSAVRPGGGHDTVAALDLAVAQLPAEAPEPRLVVLYTGAEPDAEPAAAIAQRMRSAGVLLAVVGTAGDTPDRRAASEYWATVAAGTGGVAVSARSPDVISAFDRLAAELGRRYLLTFPVPSQLPATAVVRVETGGGPVVGEVALPAAAAVSDGSGGSPLVVVAVGVACAVLLAAGAIALLRRRANPDRAAPRVPERSHRPAPADQIWNIPPRPDGLIDREALLAELAATLHMGEPVWLRSRPPVAGLGTTIAMIDYAHRHRARYDIAWWIPALDPDLVPDRLAELAQALGLAAATDSADEATAALLAALSRRHRWLLVFDEAGSPHDLSRYLPSGPGDVLIASSDPEWREHASPVSVSVFTRAESVSLLRSRRPDLAVEHADRIAATLDDLPLAVGPAAAFLADTGMDVDAFHSLLADRPPGAPDFAGSAAAWAIMVDRLAVDAPPALALLTLAAWLGQVPMPLSLVVDHPHVLPEPLAAAVRRPAELEEHTALLRRRGLALVTADDFLLHPVPAELLIARTSQDHAAVGGWTGIAVRLLRAAAPDRAAADPVTWPTWRLLLPHVLAATDPARRLDDVADEVGWLLAGAGRYLGARGRSSAAAALLEDAREFDRDARLGAVERPAGPPADDDKY